MLNVCILQYRSVRGGERATTKYFNADAVGKWIRLCVEFSFHGATAVPDVTGLGILRTTSGTSHGQFHRFATTVVNTNLMIVHNRFIHSTQQIGTL